MELWFLHYMKPVYEVSKANVFFKFAKSRGVTHYHSPSFTEGPIVDAITKVMSCTACAVSNAQDIINEAIDTHYNLQHHDKVQFEFNPPKINNYQGLEYREQFITNAKNKLLTKKGKITKRRLMRHLLDVQGTLNQSWKGNMECLQSIRGTFHRTGLSRAQIRLHLKTIARLAMPCSCRGCCGQM